MFGSIRRRIAAFGVALASFLPNPGKVSFMGAREATKSVVAAVEVVAAKAEPVVEKVAQAAGTASGKAAAGAAGVGAVAAGGVAIERGCGIGVKTLTSMEHAGGAVEGVVPSLTRDVEALAPKLGRGIESGVGKDAEELSRLKLPSEHPIPGSEPYVGSPRPPLPGRGPIWVVPTETPTHAIARTAIESADLRITGSAGSEIETSLARRALQDQSIKMTESVLMRLGRAQLQSPQEVERAFNASLGRYKSFHAILDPATGLVRMHMERNGVAIAAEFNLYSAAAAAATVIAAPGTLNPEPLQGPGRNN